MRRTEICQRLRHKPPTPHPSCSFQSPDKAPSSQYHEAMSRVCSHCGKKLAMLNLEVSFYEEQMRAEKLEIRACESLCLLEAEKRKINDSADSIACSYAYLDDEIRATVPAKLERCIRNGEADHQSRWANAAPELSGYVRCARSTFAASCRPCVSSEWRRQMPVKTRHRTRSRRRTRAVALDIGRMDGE